MHSDPQRIQTARALLRIRLLRALLTLTTLVVVWFVTSPARAAAAPSNIDPPASIPRLSGAPLCDPRGATTFAPPPQMQDVEVSLDAGLTLDDCMIGASGSARCVLPAESPVPTGPSASSDSVSDSLITAVATLAAVGRDLLPAPAAGPFCPRPGFHSTVDRPPRA